MKKAFGIVILVVAVMFLTAGLETAEAAKGGGPEAKLKGTYFRSRVRTCVRTNGDFDSTGKIIATPDVSNPTVNTRTNVTSGIITFNGDGTGTLEFDGMSVRHVTNINQSGGRPARFTGPGTCGFNYTVDPDNSFEVQTTGCSTATSTSSGTAIRGRIAKGGQSLILFDHDQNVETVVSATLPFPGSIRRICNRSGSAVRVNK